MEILSQLLTSLLFVLGSWFFVLCSFNHFTPNPLKGAFSLVVEIGGLEYDRCEIRHLHSLFLALGSLLLALDSH